MHEFNFPARLQLPWTTEKFRHDFKNKSLQESNILGNQNFQPPFKFCMQLGTQGDAQKCPF